MSYRLLIVAGEASADAHAAAFLRDLRKRCPDLDAFGVGDVELRSAGMEVLLEAKRLNIVGVFDWLDRAHEVARDYRRFTMDVRDRRPDAAVLLDLPDFNLMVARQLKDQGVPIVYYISPQVWAWRKYRLRTIRKLVDKMLVVFPFERDFYLQHGIPVEFVGHPLLDRVEVRKEYRSQSEVLVSPRIALLPGSRRSELEHHGGLLAETHARLKAKFPGAVFRVPAASTLSQDTVSEATGVPAEVGRFHEILRWADAAIVCSGTATLETALVGTPFCLFYKLGGVTEFLLRVLPLYRGFFGMPNLLHRREVVKEFLFQRATADNLVAEAVRLIEDAPYRESMARMLRECRSLLGESGASARVAGEVATVLWGKPVTA